LPTGRKAGVSTLSSRHRAPEARSLLEQAQAETNAIGRSTMRENPYYRNLTLPVGLREALVGRVKTALLAMIGAVGLALLIAVGNAANLMLARATVREPPPA
jgi:putative ABC transport system permease protein